MKEGSDEWVLFGLQSPDKVSADTALESLYTNHYPFIKRLIENNNGSDVDAADVFQDAIIVFYEKIRTGQLTLNCSIRTYLYSICKHLWLNKLRDRKDWLNIEQEEVEAIEIPPESFNVLITKERNELIVQLMNEIGPHCKEVLKLYYFKRLRMKEIAETLGLANEQGAKNKKSRCIKKLKALIEASPELKNKLI
ncbi:MAG: sigma-70 family RNA polymerase sigma factor [Bacteroidota bacterium]